MAQAEVGAGVLLPTAAEAPPGRMPAGAEVAGPPDPGGVLSGLPEDPGKRQHRRRDQSHVVGLAELFASSPESIDLDTSPGSRPCWWLRGR